MKLTKYGHACVMLEEKGQKLVIDPGTYTPELGNLEHVVGVVITHVHPDHFDPANIAKILADSPEVQIWTTEEVSEQLGNPEVHIVSGGAQDRIGPFDLRFYGELHAIMHADFPRNQNIGVLVNDTFYYPGDSYTVPVDAHVKVLALPAGGPWVKLGEAIDFLYEVKPARCFPTHNAHLSEAGHAATNMWLGKACEARHIAFDYLKPGESLEFS